MDSVMDFVNISAIHHAIQERQSSHYQTFKDLKRGNVRDVRDKKRKKLFPFLLFSYYPERQIGKLFYCYLNLASSESPEDEGGRGRCSKCSYIRCILSNKTKATYSSLTTACDLDPHFIETGTVSQPITQSTLNIRLQIGVDRHQGNSGQGCHIFETAPKGITFLT